MCDIWVNIYSVLLSLRYESLSVLLSIIFGLETELTAHKSTDCNRVISFVYSHCAVGTEISHCRNEKDRKGVLKGTWAEVVLVVF